MLAHRSLTGFTRKYSQVEVKFSRQKKGRSYVVPSPAGGMHLQLQPLRFLDKRTVM